MLFLIVSFLLHPVRFIKDMKRSHTHFDREGYPRFGHENNECECLK